MPCSLQQGVDTLPPSLCYNNNTLPHKHCTCTQSPCCISVVCQSVKVFFQTLHHHICLWSTQYQAHPPHQLRQLLSHLLKSLSLRKTWKNYRELVVPYHSHRVVDYYKSDPNVPHLANVQRVAEVGLYVFVCLSGQSKLLRLLAPASVNAYHKCMYIVTNVSLMCRVR